jgi:Anti-sigma-28 factor, FlgM
MSSGAHPMRPGGNRAETEDMTVLEVSYDTRPGRFGRTVDGNENAGRRRGDAREDSPMDLAREVHMQELRKRIERNAYDVDPHEVADAIVARLLAGRRAEEDDGR